MRLIWPVKSCEFLLASWLLFTPTNIFLATLPREPGLIAMGTRLWWMVDGWGRFRAPGIRKYLDAAQITAGAVVPRNA